MTHSVLSNEQSTLTLDLVLTLGSQVEQLNSTDSFTSTCKEALSTASAGETREVAVVASTASTEHVVTLRTVTSCVGAHVTKIDNIVEVVALEQADTCDLGDTTRGHVTNTTSVTVDRDVIGGEESVVLAWGQDGETTLIRSVLLIQATSNSIERVDKTLSSCSGCTRDFSTAVETDRRSTTSRSVQSLHRGDVEAFRKSLTEFLSVDATDIVVVLELINVGDEGRSNQNIINRDDTLCVLDSRQVAVAAIYDVFTDSVILSISDASNRELC
jgi:hypothetical protein